MFANIMRFYNLIQMIHPEYHLLWIDNQVIVEFWEILCIECAWRIIRWRQTDTVGDTTSFVLFMYITYVYRWHQTATIFYKQDSVSDMYSLPLLRYQIVSQISGWTQTRDTSALLVRTSVIVSWYTCIAETQPAFSYRWRQTDTILHCCGRLRVYILC